MTKKKIITTAAILLIIAGIAAAAIVLFKKDSSPESKSVVAANKEDSYLLDSPSGLLCPEAANTAYSNGFVYYGVSGGIVEYDIETGKSATITPKVTVNTTLSDYASYNGFIYAVKTEFDNSQTAVGNTDKYSIVKIDYNSGEVTEIYTSENAEDSIGCMSLSKDGKMYFTEGHYKKGDNDADGYNNGFGVYELDIESGSKNKLQSGNTYYIDSKRIYFTKLDEKSDTCRLFYADRETPDSVTDTGVDVVSAVSDNTPYMYYPCGDKIYYSGGTNKLSCYDIEKGSSETVCEFEEKAYVRYFQYWNDKLLVLVREPMPESSYYQYGLYYLDKDNKAVKITDDSALNEERFFPFEWIDYMTVWNDCDDYFLLSTYDPATDTMAYLFDKDLNKTEIVRDGDWDYEAFAKEQMDIGG